MACMVGLQDMHTLDRDAPWTGVQKTSQHSGSALLKMAKVKWLPEPRGCGGGGSRRGGGGVCGSHGSAVRSLGRTDGHLAGAEVAALGVCVRACMVVGQQSLPSWAPAPYTCVHGKQ